MNRSIQKHTLLAHLACTLSAKRSRSAGQRRVCQCCPSILKTRQWACSRPFGNNSPLARWEASRYSTCMSQLHVWKFWSYEKRRRTPPRLPKQRKLEFLIIALSSDLSSSATSFRGWNCTAPEPGSLGALRPATCRKHEDFYANTTVGRLRSPLTPYPPYHYPGRPNRW